MKLLVLVCLALLAHEVLVVAVSCEFLIFAGRAFSQEEANEDMRYESSEEEAAAVPMQAPQLPQAPKHLRIVSPALVEV